MSDRAASLFDRVRKPEYTGQNRCVPCTIVNVVIALAASAVAGIVAIELAGAVFAGSLLAIYLRGYLVPGTPALTKRYLPDRVLALFDKPVATAEQDDETEWETLNKLERERRNEVDPERFLLDVGCVERVTSDGASTADVPEVALLGARFAGDLRFTDEFAALVASETAAHCENPADRATLAAMFDAEPDEVAFKDRDYPAISVGHRVRRWPGKAALLADVSTHEALTEWTDRWADVPLEQRVNVLKSLRSFRGECPLCSGETYFSEDTVESCCRSFDVVAIRCRDCDEPLLEFDPSEVSSDPPTKGVQP